MSKLDNKVALVTGAGRGIGRQIALRLASEGAFVIIHYGTNRAGAEEVLAEIEGVGGQGFVVGADLAELAGIEQLFQGVDQGLVQAGQDQLDILVNNAGIGMHADLTAITPEAFDRVMAVDARAPLFVAQEAARRMEQGGRIINISSMVAHRAYGGFSIAYGAAKAALEYMTVAMADSLGARGITANVVVPGATETDFIKGAMQDVNMVAQLKASSALGEIGQPEDIASVVAFLASPDSRWVTGASINASGGTLL